MVAGARPARTASIVVSEVLKLRVKIALLSHARRGGAMSAPPPAATGLAVAVCSINLLFGYLGPLTELSIDIDDEVGDFLERP